MRTDIELGRRYFRRAVVWCNQRGLVCVVLHSFLLFVDSAMRFTALTGVTMPEAERPCLTARLNYLTERVRSLGARAGLTVGHWRRIEAFLEDTTEMRDVFEAAFKGDLRHVHLGGAKQRGGIIEAFPEQPFARRFLKVALKIALERREAAMTQPGVFFQ